MIKYGQAELMYYIMHQFLNKANLTEQEKEKIDKQNADEVFAKYPSARDLEIIV